MTTSFNKPLSPSDYKLFTAPERFELLMKAMARGDSGEEATLRRTCPQKSYRGPDMEFEDRVSIAMDIGMVAIADIGKVMAGLHAFDWTTSNVYRFSAFHIHTAKKAFEDGVRYQQELPQAKFLAQDLRALFQAGRRASAVIEESDGPTDGADMPAEKHSTIRVSGQADPPLKVAAERKDEFFDRGFAVEDRTEFMTELFLNAIAAKERALLVQLRSIWCAIEQFCLSRLNLRPDELLTACGYPDKAELEAALARNKDCQPDEQRKVDYLDALHRVWDRRFKIPSSDSRGD